MEILVTNNAGVRTLKLNRPQVFNSFNQAMAFALHKELDAAQADPTVRAIILTGEGKAFCAGQDLAEVMDPNGPELPAIVENIIIQLLKDFVQLKNQLLEL